MKSLLKVVVLSAIVLNSIICNADQFDIPDGDINALKTAIITANSNNKPDTIHLAPFGMYSFTVADNNFLMSGDNALPALKLDGSAANSLVIFGNGATFMRDPSITTLRLLYVLDVKVTLYDLNFIGGSTLQFSNKAGAIMINSGDVTVENCLFKDNRASEGGVISLGGRSAFTAKNCTFTNNLATAGTGSVFTSIYGSTYFQNCVIVNNKCVNVNAPAAIYNFTPLNSNTTIDNIYLKNCIVAKNTYDNPSSPDNGKEFDIAGAVYSNGGNIIGSYPVVTETFFPTFRQGTPHSRNDHVGTETVYVDPLLGSLGNHGLFTDFYPVLSGSPALSNGAGIKNAGVPAVASNGIIPAEAYPGETITITGINLQAINKVQFAGAPTIVSGITSTSRTVQVAVHANAQTGQILLMDPVPHFIFTSQSLKVKTVVTPATPTNLAGISESTSSIKLTWTDVANEDDYQIEYKKVTDNAYSLLETVNANTTTYVAENLLCSMSYDFRVIARGHGTVSPHSNIVQLAPLQLQAVELTPTSTEGCKGGIITLTAPAGYNGYSWDSGETTHSIDVEHSGVYTVQVTDESGCTSSPSPAVTLTFYDQPDTAVFQNGNILTTSVIADHYQWYFEGDPLQDKTSNSLTVTHAGTYQLELSTHGCSSFSREFTFQAPVSPEFLTTSLAICAGTTDVVYSVSPINNATTYRWTFSGTGFNVVSGTGTNALTVDFDPTATSGILSVEAEVLGIKSEASKINITVNHTPSPMTSINGNSTVQSGSTGNTFSVSDPGGVTFEWSYDGDGVTLIENNNVVNIDLEPDATSGTLTVTLSNECGTVVGATLLLNVEHTITGSEEVISNQISIYPSPSDGKFIVNVPDSFGTYKMTISNLLGSPTYKTTGSGATPVNLNGRGRGLYLIVIEAGQKRFLEKIYVK